MNKKIANLLYVVLIILVITFMIFIIVYLKTHKEAFFDNPFTYGASRMGNVECSCTQQLPGGLSAQFSFNDTEIRFKENANTQLNKILNTTKN